MSDINRKIKEARPRLQTIAPLSSSITTGFAIFNIVLGAGLMFQKARTVEFFIVNDFLNYQIWGAIFMLLGVVMGTALIMNSWRITRWSLLIGIFLKLWWWLALLVRDVFQDGNNTLFLGLWTFVTFVQIILYINFLPKDLKGKTD